MRVPLPIRYEPVLPGAFARRVTQAIGGPLKALSIRTVQLNIGLQCNLACRHCHVESSPRRKEQMTWETMKLALLAAKKVRAATLDVTGGEPELHPQFRKLIESARKADLQVTVRSNLVIFLRPEHHLLPKFLKKHRVRLVGSLPSCDEEAVDQQRGSGVFHDTVLAIQSLNAIGYGVDPTLPLDLIHNPLGTSMPGHQGTLEQEYKRNLDMRFGIRFTQLFAMSNMPIGRLRRDLARDGRLTSYSQKLQAGFNRDTLDGLMCRHELHVGPDGTLYDCDFNYALSLTVDSGTPAHIRDFDPTSFLQRKIANGEHCFGCTAGRGSSWGGALV